MQCAKNAGRHFVVDLLQFITSLPYKQQRRCICKNNLLAQTATLT